MHSALPLGTPPASRPLDPRFTIRVQKLSRTVFAAKLSQLEYLIILSLFLLPYSK